MKEATAELNSTVITVIAVAAFAAFFFTILWPRINQSIDVDTKCADAICENCTGNNCTTVKCTLNEKEFDCIYKG
ncbi:MAG: hypothetical protein R3Y13_04145 [bacterium]